MASFLDKFKIKTAMQTNTTLDLSCQHITTADWMELNPIYIKEMVPGESIDINMSTFTRMAPMAVPTLGRGLIHNRAFFVPMRTIYSRWDDFITRSPSANVANQGGVSNGYILDRVPYTTNYSITNFFIGCVESGTSYFTYSSTNYLTAIGTAATDQEKAEADVAVKVVSPNGTGATVTFYYYNFTDLGRSIYKILTSLGYNLPWTTNLYSNTSASTAINSAMNAECAFTQVSLMPLLSFVKLYIDWYWPAQYVGDARYNVLKSICDYTPCVNNLPQFTAYGIGQIFNNLVDSSNKNGITVNYDSSYLVSAFDTPEGPDNTKTGTITIPNIDYNSSNSAAGQVTNGTTSAIYAGTANMATYNNTLTQYGLHALHALTDYLKRHQLVGVRALDRFYARFGISLPSEALKRSKYIGAMNVPLQIGDVMSHTDSSAASPLGAYAGKGVGYGENGFSYKADDFGYIVICSSIVPQVGYYQGLDRMNLHISPLDFYTPEFDQLGNQAISRFEVYCADAEVISESGTVASDEAELSALTNSDMSGIFGWTPRYSEYKIGQDRISGDFRVKSKSIVGDTDDAWHLNRSLTKCWKNAGSMVHSQYFVNGFDAKQYNRVFYNTEDNADKFYLIHNFKVTSNSPMHSLYDTYHWEEGGKEVVADVNGVKVN